MPVAKSIIFDKSAQKLAKGFAKLLKISAPPSAMINPKITTKCINNFFLSGNFSVKNPNVSIGIPKIDGMKEVKELL